MDKGSDELTAVTKEAAALLKAGMYHKALPKIKSALTMAKKAGDGQAATALYSWIIACHERLGEVSSVECERISKS
jgi:hypothetical protein